MQNALFYSPHNVAITEITNPQGKALSYDFKGRAFSCSRSDERLRLSGRLLDR